MKVSVSVFGRFHFFDLAKQLNDKRLLFQLVTTYPKFKVREWGVNKKIVLSLRYVNNESAIHEIGRVSKPGRRIYKDSNSILPVAGGMGISILTTNIGVITDKKARREKVGGELVCIIW